MKQSPEQNRDCPQSHRGLSQDFAPCTAPGSAASDYLPQHVKGTTLNGHGYVVAYHHQHIELLQRSYPEHVVFSPAEMAALKGMGKEEAELMLLAKKTYDGVIEKTLPLESEVVEELPISDEPEPVQGSLL
ncbi:MAG: hypothetical protein KAT62_00665 [Desulfuromonadales bacterium]|nr:hypothetical protein [Desulfuromonadales bacterium]